MCGVFYCLDTAVVRRGTFETGDPLRFGGDVFPTGNLGDLFERSLVYIFCQVVFLVDELSDDLYLLGNVLITSELYSMALTIPLVVSDRWLTVSQICAMRTAAATITSSRRSISVDPV